MIGIIAKKNRATWSWGRVLINSDNFNYFTKAARYIYRKDLEVEKPIICFAHLMLIGSISWISCRCRMGRGHFVRSSSLGFLSLRLWVIKKINPQLSCLLGRHPTNKGADRSYRSAGSCCFGRMLWPPGFSTCGPNLFWSKYSHR